MSAESKDLLNEQAASRASESTRSANCTCVCVSASLVLFLGATILCALATGPLHARCSVSWSVSLPCFDVSSLLANQIKEWTTETCPPKTQKCLYYLVAMSGDDIVATHTTPLMRFVDDITFNFSSPAIDRCDIKGHSTSRSWYAIMDSGTNYLNMYNLMRGSGLSSSPSFTESTSDHVCTQYSTARQKLDQLSYQNS